MIVRVSARVMSSLCFVKDEKMVRRHRETG